MYMRKDPLINGQFYHIFNRSISKYVIFDKQEDFLRFIDLLSLYRYKEFDYKYSRFSQLELEMQSKIKKALLGGEELVKIIAFCLMPTHLHLMLKQTSKNGITIFTSKVLNSYSRYFNLKHHRKGPLWEGHFKNVSISTDEQLLHLTRYIHLNPCSVGLVDKPEKWGYSSYKEYLRHKDGFCDFAGLAIPDPKRYRKFVNNHKKYQKELSLIKALMIDNYAG